MKNILQMTIKLFYNFLKPLLILILFNTITMCAVATANEKFVMPKVEITDEEKYPLKRVKQEQNKVSDTVEKTIKVLDKIEYIEKEKDKVYYDKITTIEPKKAADQYCYVKITIKQSGDNIFKEETLECADGRKKVDGPSYWQLFAQFYYRDVSTPEYCRSYSRPGHAFKSFGKTCLNKDGEWKVK